jgi:hypothetical protein
MTFIGNTAGAVEAAWNAENLSYPMTPLTRDQLVSLTGFANSQSDYAQQIGVDPTVYMFAALGVGELSATLQTPNGQSFWGQYSPTAMSDNQFVQDTYRFYFDGAIPQPDQFNAQLHLLQYYENLYAAAGLSDPNLLARGAFVGIDLGIWAEVPGHIIGNGPV